MVSEILVQLCLGGGHTSVPIPYANLVVTPPKGWLFGCTFCMKYAESCLRVILFRGWYSRAHGGFVVLLCAYGFRYPGPALPWGRPHTHTHTHTRYPDHMETPFQGQCPIHVVFEPWVYNLISHVSWIATHALRNNHIITLRVAPSPLMY